MFDQCQLLEWLLDGSLWHHHPHPHLRAEQEAHEPPALESLCRMWPEL